MNRKNGLVALRDFTLEDIPLKIDWINNPENNRYLHYDLPLEYEKTKNWFLRKNNDVRMDCVIEYEHRPVGVIGLLNIDCVNRKAEFYITIGSIPHKRKGVASAATRLLLDYAFFELNLNKVYLNVDADNAAACCFCEKTVISARAFFFRSC